MNQYLLLGFLAVIATLSAIAVVDFDPVDDDLLVEVVADALSVEKSKRLTRVTDDLFLMANPIAQLCRAPLPSDQQHNPHGDKYVHVYSNGLGLKTIQSGDGKYPIGSIIVKQKFSDETGANTELFTVMRKMDKGYDASNGNWEYSVLNADASLVLSRGKTDSCIECHADYSSTDYVTRLYIE